LALNTSNRLRVAAIKFLNPAPLMWDFEHGPRNTELAERYDVHYTQPSECADQLLDGRADVGLIPIASLTPELAIVPGCTIASLDRVRSIQLIVKLKNGTTESVEKTLTGVRTVAADTASRSSLAYAQVLFRRFALSAPTFIPAPANPIAMLSKADAALLIGDPALLALEHRADIEHAVGSCLWLDIAQEWRSCTGLPWVAAVWAVRPEALNAGTVDPQQLISDLQQSRDNGLQHIRELVEEWAPQIEIPPSTIRYYLTRNIHYTLTPECIETIQLFRQHAAKSEILPPLPELRFL
jgi:chorismate dehydratase